MRWFRRTLVAVLWLACVPMVDCSSTVASRDGVAHAQPRPFPRPKPPAPKPPAPKPTPPAPPPAYATLLVSVDMDCNLFVDDAEKPVSISAYKPTKVPISQGEHILRWQVPSAGVTFNGKLTVDKPGQQVYEYKVGDDVRNWQARQEQERKALQDRESRLQDAAGTVVRGDLMWTVRDNGIDVTWKEAKAYSEACRVGGYTDWRMPTIEELQGLYVEGNRMNISKPFELTSTWQWSATLAGSSSAFYFNFSLGDRYSLDLALRSGIRVLCVRRSGE